MIVMFEKDVEFIGGKVVKIIEFMLLKICYWIYYGKML